MDSPISTPYYKYYHYDPSIVASCIFAVLFGVSTALHVLLIFKHRTWFFIPVIGGGLFEIAGYAARAVSHTQVPNLTLGPYVVQTLLILVAPPLFAASVYMVLGRLIVRCDAEACSLIKRRWLVKVFVTSDVVCFIVQLGGAGLMASSQSTTATTGSHIVLAGLLVQIVIFGFFLVVAVVFHRRYRGLQQMQKPISMRAPWQTTLLVLYLASGFILVRSVVRVAEFVEGFDGYIILHEIFLYLFDAVPMLAVSILYLIWYPSDLSVRISAAKDEETDTGSGIELPET